MNKEYTDKSLDDVINEFRAKDDDIQHQREEIFDSINIMFDSKGVDLDITKIPNPEQIVKAFLTFDEEDNHVELGMPEEVMKALFIYYHYMLRSDAIIKKLSNDIYSLQKTMNANAKGLQRLKCLKCANILKKYKFFENEG